MRSAVWGTTILAVGVLSWSVGRGDALAGYALGCVAGLLGAIGLWALVRLISRPEATPGEPATRRDAWSAAMSVGLLLLKLPTMLALMLLAANFGSTGAIACLAGIAMVYSTLIGWALARG